MAIYSVIIVGAGIKIPAVPEPIIGFFTTRIVKAENAEEAVTIAIKRVKADWEKSEYIKINIEADLILELDKVNEIGLIKAIKNRNIGKGYTFFS